MNSYPSKCDLGYRQGDRISAANFATEIPRRYYPQMPYNPRPVTDNTSKYKEFVTSNKKNITRTLGH